MSLAKRVEKCVSKQLPLPLDLMVDRWLGTYGNPNTRETYRQNIQDFQGFAADRSFDEELIQDYCQSIHRRIEQGEIARGTGRLRLFVFSAFLKWCCVLDLFPNLSVEQVDYLVKIPKKDSRISPKEVLSKEEVELLIDHCRDIREEALITLLAGSGLRVSEVVELSPDNILKKEGETNEYWLEVIEGKGGKDRTLPIAPDVYETVAKYLQIQRRGIDEPDDDPIFVSRMSDEVTPKTINNIIKRVTRRSGLGRNITCHNLRHTYATQKLMQGVPLRTVSQRLGHASLDTTEEHYIWLVDQLEQEQEEAWWQVNDESNEELSKD